MPKELVQQAVLTILGLKVTSDHIQSKDMLKGELLSGGILMLSDATRTFDLIGQGKRTLIPLGSRRPTY